jgi:putative alpha-1,2-mannosidase
LTAGASDGTTWLSTNATQGMLYGCLIEAYTFMKGEPDLMQEYEKRFSEAMVGIKMLGESKEVTDQYRTGMIMRPKQ